VFHKAVDFRGIRVDGSKHPMKTLAFLLIVVCVTVGATAVTGAVVFLLIGLSTTPSHRQPRSPRSV